MKFFSRLHLQIIFKMALFFCLSTSLGCNPNPVPSLDYNSYVNLYIYGLIDYNYEGNVYISTKNQTTGSKLEAKIDTTKKVISVFAKDSLNDYKITIYVLYKNTITRGQIYSNNIDIVVPYIEVNYRQKLCKTSFYDCQNLRTLPAVFTCTVGGIDKQKKIIALEFNGEIGMPDGLIDCFSSTGGSTVKITKWKRMKMRGNLEVKYEE